MHVLEAADDLNVFGIGDDRVRRLGDRLQTASAESVSRGPASFDGETGHQPNRTSHVEPLFALLLHVAEHDVFDNGNIDAATLNDRTNDRDGQVIGPDFAEYAPLGVGATDRRAAGFDYDGGFHRGPFL